jgi:hypothetical protein
MVSCGRVGRQRLDDSGCGESFLAVSSFDDRHGNRYLVAFAFSSCFGVCMMRGLAHGSTCAWILLVPGREPASDLHAEMNGLPRNCLCVLFCVVIALSRRASRLEPCVLWLGRWCCVPLLGWYSVHGSNGVLHACYT